MAATLEAYENEVRECNILTGNSVEDTIMLLNLKKMVPETIRERLETHDVQTYAEAKEYALKQVRNLKPKIKLTSIDLHEQEEEEEEEKPPKKTRFQEESREEDNNEDYSKDDLLAWPGKGPGKGRKGANQKGGKRKGRQGGVPRGLPLLRRLRSSD